jgi:hypothetical protein
MTKETKSSANLTVEQCRELAVAMFEEAAALPPGPKKDGMLKLAHGYSNLAATKDWLAKKAELDLSLCVAARCPLPRTFTDTTTMSSVDGSRVGRVKLKQWHWSGAVFWPAC